MDQEMLVPEGRVSVKVELTTGPPALLLTLMVKEIGLPAVTGAGVEVVTVRLPTLAGGKATTTSLNCLVRAVMAASTFLLGLKPVVMSNSNWQKMGGTVATGGLPTSMGELQSVPKGEVLETA